MSWRQFREIYSIQTNSGRTQCMYNTARTVKIVPYLESSMGLIYEELFNIVANFIYFG